MNRPPTLGAAPDGARAARFTTVAADVWEPLQRYLRRRTSAADVDDIAAETLAVMWRRIDDIPDGAELPWCYSIARRSLANHRRSDVRRRNLVARITSRGVAAASHDGDPGATVDPTDPSLQAALALLSADDRELLTLWAWEQLSVSEIAVVLDISPNTASVRLRRARQRIAGHLDDRLGGVAIAERSATCHIDVDPGHTEDGRTQEMPR